MNRLGRGWDRLSKIGIKKIMKGEWEYAIKPEFSLKSKAVYIVDIPAEAFPTKAHQTDTSREPVIKNGRMHFKQYVPFAVKLDNIDTKRLDRHCKQYLLRYLLLLRI
jgi:hypothetical protein